MTIANQRSLTSQKSQLGAQRLTLDEYLTFDDGTETIYEAVDGIPIEMGAESDTNLLIESFLFSVFLQLVPYYRLRKGAEIAVAGRYANTRIPDLMILTESGAEALRGKKRSIVMFDMPAPLLAIEVVSSSDSDQRSYDRDYVRKRQEYAERGIPEYWIIDPVASCVLVLTLSEGIYREQKYTDNQQLTSPSFPTLEITAQQILEA